MKETTSVSLAGIAFTLDNECYVLLKNYLREREVALRGEANAEQLLAQLETTIAERILSIQSAAMPVSLKVLRPIVDSLGGASSIPEQQTMSAPRERLSRRLHRNPDHAILGGVCSGIATYFNISLAVVRILFLIPLFFGSMFSLWFTPPFMAGFSLGFFSPIWAFLCSPTTIVVLYLILWIAMPKAKTPLQKIEMQGDRSIGEGSSAVLGQVARGVALFFGALSALWTVVLVVFASLFIFNAHLWFGGDVAQLCLRAGVCQWMFTLAVSLLLILPPLGFAYLLISVGMGWKRGRKATMLTMLLLWISTVIFLAVVVVGNVEMISQWSNGCYHSGLRWVD